MEKCCLSHRRREHLQDTKNRGSALYVSIFAYNYIYVNTHKSTVSYFRVSVCTGAFWHHASVSALFPIYTDVVCYIRMHARTWIWKGSILCMHYGLLQFPIIHKRILNVNRTGYNVELKKIPCLLVCEFSFQGLMSCVLMGVTCVRSLVGALCHRTWSESEREGAANLETKGIRNGTKKKGAVGRSRKATVSFAMSLCVCPSARNDSAHTERIFMKFNIWLFFFSSKFCLENSSFITIWQ
jgi:hypothetical protein